LISIHAGRRFRARLIGCLLVLGLAGCGKSIPTAEVDGVLIINGKPGDKVRVQFDPDGEKGGHGPPSTAETDATGHFTLELMSDSGKRKPGAVVGWHRVTLSDIRLSESSTGKGVPIRFGPDYTLPGSTPLQWEVKPDKQTIELKIP